ncbi:unnamed protein product [Pleuronectes platessa]|uniref:Uncharacterized protein n=1 Tax=Pleuronectes platessa TaxID=8262 RepID=A0A9N7UIU6_PLEPL|nr:unnamed protein product [Pleuronectes platessa]
MVKPHSPSTLHRPISCSLTARDSCHSTTSPPFPVPAPKRWSQLHVDIKTESLLIVLQTEVTARTHRAVSDHVRRPGSRCWGSKVPCSGALSLGAVEPETNQRPSLPIVQVSATSPPPLDSILAVYASSFIISNSRNTRPGRWGSGNPACPLVPRFQVLTSSDQAAVSCGCFTRVPSW